MYAFLDQRVPDLNRGGQFLVWSMRSWVQSLGGKGCAALALVPTFSKCGVILALPHFHSAMSLLNRDGVETFRFSPVCCPLVTEDEALLLSIFRTLRDAEGDRARQTLELLVIEDAIAPLLASFSAVTTRLIEADLMPECLASGSVSAKTADL